MSQTPKPRPFGIRERILFRLYVNCGLMLEHPRQLQSEYDLTYEDLAFIAGCTTRTIERWMSQSREPKVVKELYLRRLGEFYFLLRCYHHIPSELWNLICPLSEEDLAVLYPQSD